jgi:hypothetical protein
MVGIRKPLHVGSLSNAESPPYRGGYCVDTIGLARITTRAEPGVSRRARRHHKAWYHDTNLRLPKRTRKGAHSGHCARGVELRVAMVSVLPKGDGTNGPYCEYPSPENKRNRVLQLTTNRALLSPRLRDRNPPALIAHTVYSSCVNISELNPKEHSHDSRSEHHVPDRP